MGQRRQEERLEASDNAIRLAPARSSASTVGTRWDASRSAALSELAAVACRCLTSNAHCGMSSALQSTVRTCVCSISS